MENYNGVKLGMFNREEKDTSEKILTTGATATK